MNSTSMEKYSNQPRKVKFPCKLCKGNHLLRYFPGIPKILEVWYTKLNQPLEIMLVINYQLLIVRSMGNRVKLNFLKIYVKGIIIFTSFHVYMKSQKCWKTLHLLSHDFQLINKIIPLILH